jgi:hypothetical protein
MGMNLPNFSKVDPLARPGEARVRQQIRFLKGDLEWAGFRDPKEDPEARKDRYIAAIPILIKNFFGFLEKEMVTKRPEINWDKAAGFKVSFLSSYDPLILELSTVYFTELCDQVRAVLKRHENKEAVSLTEDQRAYVSFVLDDPNPNGGLTMLLPADGLYTLSHIAGLVLDLGVEDLEGFQKVLGSKSVMMFANSLMINDSAGLTLLMKVLAKNKEVYDHKLKDYAFNIDFFEVSNEGNIVLRNDIVTVIKDAFIKNRNPDGDEIRRNCPASYSPKETNHFFTVLIGELVYQYAQFLKSEKPAEQ